MCAHVLIITEVEEPTHGGIAPPKPSAISKEFKFCFASACTLRLGSLSFARRVMRLQRTT
jgi:hypothetical protein